nr:MAG TPA: hypothetical protein [Caudoviricetes sp.]
MILSIERLVTFSIFCILSLRASGEPNHTLTDRVLDTVNLDNVTGVGCADHLSNVTVNIATDLGNHADSPTVDRLIIGPVGIDQCKDTGTGLRVLLKHVDNLKRSDGVPIRIERGVIKGNVYRACILACVAGFYYVCHFLYLPYCWVITQFVRAGLVF